MRTAPKIFISFLVIVVLLVITAINISSEQTGTHDDRVIYSESSNED
ncbi:hypothetical protein J2S78_002682 [Salibacterium salarium]|nr:hypothetical protein [Salibacterium salarium]MDQ0300235.1 hypothetical protein [Salibacterium salarium]